MYIYYVYYVIIVYKEEIYTMNISSLKTNWKPDDDLR
jgi:hypothetical protein